MKIKIMLHAMTFAAVLASCQTNGESSQKSGIDLANLDSTYLPGTDFYMFATGGWQKAHPLTDEIGRAHVCSSHLGEYLVCRLLLEKKNFF